MSTNFETATAFVRCKTAQAGHLSATTWGLYSYATKIATYETTTVGQLYPVILLTVRDYSATTIRHKHHTRTAARREGVTLFEVPNFDRPTEEEHRANLAHLCRLAQEATERANRCRKESTRQSWRAEADRRAQAAAKYAHIFGLSE